MTEPEKLPICGLCGEQWVEQGPEQIVHNCRAPRTEGAVLTDQTTPSEQARQAIVDYGRAEYAAATNGSVNAVLETRAALDGLFARQEAELARLKEKLSYRDRASTHSDECWKWHPACAERKIAELEAELAAIRSSTQWHRVEDGLPPIGVLCLWWRRGWHPAVAMTATPRIADFAATHWREIGELPVLPEGK